MLRSLFTQVCLGFVLSIVAIPTAKSGITDVISSQQTKHKYITLEFPKLDDNTRHHLVKELNSYEAKIIEVIFHDQTNQMTIYYSDLIKLDDIYSIIMKHTGDFNKISGTELQ